MSATKKDKNAKPKPLATCGIKILIWSIIGAVVLICINQTRPSRGFVEGQTHVLDVVEEVAWTEVSVIEIRDDLFIRFIAEKPSSWTVPSGPPIFIFDRRGYLIDWMDDIGDAPTFAKKWRVVRVVKRLESAKQIGEWLENDFVGWALLPVSFFEN